MIKDIEEFEDGVEELNDQVSDLGSMDASYLLERIFLLEENQGHGLVFQYLAENKEPCIYELIRFASQRTGK